MTTTIEQPSPTVAPTAEQVAAKVKAVWESGDYARFADYLKPGALKILDGFDIKSGDKVLDIACGAGQTAIPAALNGAEVTGLDIASNLVEIAQQRADKAGANARFDQGDACALPYDDNQFDVVFSVIGAMFAPFPEQVAAEMLRVCKQGGCIHMANWTPEGMVGDMLRTVSKFVPPPPSIKPPTLWGNEETVLLRFGDAIENITLERKHYHSFNYPFEPAAVTDWFIQYYGPSNRAYAAIDNTGQQSLRESLTEIFSRYNQANDGSTSLKAEYLAFSANKK